ncbi:MAG: RGCVC family protein [Pseudonocardiaceae bacterium]
MPTTEVKPAVTKPDTGEQTDLTCAVCPHAWDAHDPIGIRYCSATVAGELHLFLPTILRKDDAMHAMTLHAQADLWKHGSATFAALFMEGEMRSLDNKIDRTDVLLYAVMNRGLHLATDLPRLVLRPRLGWAVRLSPAGGLTLTWPHVQPLLLDAPLNLPAGWREAAAEHGLVLLFVGDRLGLGEQTEGHPANPRKRAAQVAERGQLAAGAIAYQCQQQGGSDGTASHGRPNGGRAGAPPRAEDAHSAPWVRSGTLVLGHQKVHAEVQRGQRPPRRAPHLAPLVYVGQICSGSGG